LSAVFEWFERKPGSIHLMPEKIFQPDAFATVFQVPNDREKAGRIWNGLQKRLDKKWLRRLYCTYLSEKPQAFAAIFHFCCAIFQQEVGYENNYGDEYVLALSQIAVKVEREKHRMEAFIRFQQLEDGLFYCGIDPDFNVLPLILNHFKNRYADQKWLIYDLSRNYGLYYDLNKVEEVSMELHPALLKSSAVPVEEKEQLYAQLWKDYFRSTNIVARKNTKLHVKHVPKRYWRYLTEKQI
ncbi:MAG: TIGR03915 family putative DNA repair protein, partial [Pedobacter sp.]|nr:TIGR03915 family putative DNA repair protein [Pedobacter sp.]